MNIPKENVHAEPEPDLLVSLFLKSLNPVNMVGLLSNPGLGFTSNIYIYVYHEKLSWIRQGSNGYAFSSPTSCESGQKLINHDIFVACVRGK